MKIRPAVVTSTPLAYCLLMFASYSTHAADITVCQSGCLFNDLDPAVDSIGESDLIKARLIETATVSLTQGSTIIVSNNANWSNGQLLVGDLVKFSGDSVWYKINAVNGATSATLDRAYEGVSRYTQSTTVASLERIRILVGEGLYNVCNLHMRPGIDIEGAGRELTFLNGADDNGINSVACVTAFENFGDNNVKNLTIGPTDPAFPHMDRLVSSVNTKIWAGTHSVFEDVHINVSNPGSIHSGPSINWPIVRGGSVEINNSQITYDNMGAVLAQAFLPAGQSLTIRNSTITKVASPTPVLIPYAFVIGCNTSECQYDIVLDSVTFEQSDTNIDNWANFAPYGTGFLTSTPATSPEAGGHVNVTVSNSNLTGANSSTNDTKFRMFNIAEHTGTLNLYVFNSQMTSQGPGSKDIVNLDTADDGSNTSIVLWNSTVTE